VGILAEFREKYDPVLSFFVRRWEIPQIFSSFRYRKSANFLDVQQLIATLLIRAQQKSKSSQTLVLVSTDIKGLNKKCRTILAFHTFFNVDTEKM
jgi:hypothetical protein